MSRTYIGPFGRILPVVDNSDEDSSSSDGREPPTQPSRSDMATYQLPPPQIPTRLDFGSDPRPGFSEPKNYNVSSQSRRTVEQHRQSFDEPRRPHTAQHGQLPSVSQLLTPGSQSSSASSPYSTHQSPASSDNRPEQSSPGRSNFRSTSPQVGGYPYPNAYAASLYPPASHDSQFNTRPKFAGGSAIPPYGVPIQPSRGPNGNSFPHPGAIPQGPHPTYPPQPPQPTGSVSAPYGTDQTGLYDYGPSLHARPDPTAPNIAQNVKPVPRVVGEQDIPGEGPCWVYEDGSICRKVIDGEAVNAQWGVTKAGKPRKRLAIACTTCREKKIKCDPGEGKCQQCEKFGRECRFTTA
ncbi:MAG: hypothetical protein L6R39_000771 [Caloplaca ligustica]|nr:MAG: hypothetical protein L6R39_000771 [Caloplaca ligustica]